MAAYDELELAEAVSAGAEFMDAIDAGVTDDAERWFWVVEPATLDMSSNGNGTGDIGCITAQHHPEGRVNFGAYAVYDMGPLFRTAFNFQGRAGQRTPRVKALTALWREAIYDRRSAWFDAHPEAVISEGASA